MASKALDHFASYEWTGLFWFPEAEDKKFSGTVKYSPETGIRVELLETDFSGEDNLKRKLLYGAVTGEGTGEMSLINVSLSLGTISSVRILRGTAGYLLQGFHVQELTFDSLDIQYEKQFENIFFRDPFRERDIIASDNTRVSPGENINISLSINSQGTWVGPDDIDTIFWSRNEEWFKAFKSSMAEFLKDRPFELFKRNTLFPTFKIEKPDSTLHELFTIEEKWRSFWELALDRELLPRSVWLKVPYRREGDDEIHSEKVPLLIYFKPLNKKRDTFILEQLPINILSFGDIQHDLSVIDAAITKWFSMKNTQSWNPVMYGITRILQRKHRQAETSDYISLVAEITTFLDLVKKAPQNLDTLIDCYATEGWKEALSKILPLRTNETMGQFLSDIRNAIVHPRKTDKNYKRHFVIINEYNPQDNHNLFQKVFAHLAGLFIRAVLIELDSISLNSIDKYTEKFIGARGSLRIVEYS